MDDIQIISHDPQVFEAGPQFTTLAKWEYEKLGIQATTMEM